MLYRYSIDRNPNPSEPIRQNPRVVRTRGTVLAVARELLSEEGPAYLTYSELSRRSGVGRQTLYRHWPSKASLLVDIVLTGPPTPYPEPGTDGRAVMIAFLSSLQAGMDDRATASAVLAIAAGADRDPESATALEVIVSDRRNALNAVLAPSGYAVDVDEFAGLCGPILFRRLLAHGVVTRALIERTVDAWLATPSFSAGVATVSS
jgi:AcrR family transcriptional regulator